MVKVIEAEYAPVLYWGLSGEDKVNRTVFGSWVLHPAPPPVQTPPGMVTRGVCVEVARVWVPEQPVPSVAPLQR